MSGNISYFPGKGQILSSFTDSKEKTIVPAVELLYQRLGEPAIPLAAFISSYEVYRQLAENGRIINGRVITIIDFTKLLTRKGCSLSI